MPAATPRILTKEQRVGIIQQDKTSNHWSAPAAANAAFETQFYDRAGTTPDPNVQVDQFNNMTGRGGVMTEYDNVNVDAITGLKTIPFTGIVTKLTAAKHLVAFFQLVTEAATTPYAKQFKFADDVLDWAFNEGYLFTVAMDTGISGKGIILENALLNEYSLVIEPQARGVGVYMKHSGTWIGNEMNYNQTLNGTWTNPAKTFFNTTAECFAPNLDITVGSDVLTSVPFYRFEFKGMNNISDDFAVCGGKAGNYLWAPSAQFIIDIPYNASTCGLLGAYASGSLAKVVSLDNGVAAHADKDFIFTNTYGHLKTNPYKYDKEYVALRLEIEIERPTAAGAWGDIIQLTDTLDGGY